MVEGQGRTAAVVAVGRVWCVFCRTDLRNVGEAMSGYLEPGCRRPDWFDEQEVGLDLGEVESAVAPS